MKASLEEVKYIVEKISLADVNSEVSRSGSCKERMNEKRRQEENQEEYGVRYGCYNVRTFGSTFYSVKSQVCRESWGSKGERAGKVYSYDAILLRTGAQGRVEE